MGIMFSSYDRICLSGRNEDKEKAGEDKWLEIEKIPDMDNDSPALSSKRISKKNARKYSRNLRPIDRSQMRFEKSLEEKTYMDLFGKLRNIEDPNKENAARKHDDKELQLSEVKLQSDSQQEDDNDSEVFPWSDTDGEESTTIHTEDLNRCGITRRIAVKMANENQLLKQESERHANQLIPSTTKLPSCSDTRHVASAEITAPDSKNQADEHRVTKANEPSVVELPHIPDTVIQQCVNPGHIVCSDSPTQCDMANSKKAKQKSGKLKLKFKKKSKSVLNEHEAISCDTSAITQKQPKVPKEDIKPTAEDKIPKPKEHLSRIIKRELGIGRTKTSIILPLNADFEPMELFTPTRKAPDMYEMFQGTTDCHNREVLSVELDEEYTKACEKAKEKGSTKEKTTKNTTKLPKFWKRENKKAAEVKEHETKKPSEAKCSKSKFSKFNIFKRKQKTPVKPFKAPRTRYSYSDEQEVGEEERVKWFKLKISQTAIGPKPSDIYSRR